MGKLINTYRHPPPPPPPPPNISRILIGNEIVDHLDEAGASPVGAAPTTSSYSTSHMASMAYETRNSQVVEFGVSYARSLTVTITEDI